MSYKDKVKTEINRALSEGNEETNKNIKIKEVARKIGISLRSLQRRLAEENASFRDILDESRKDQAQKLLKTLSVGGATQALGFTDRGGFYAAYKRWFDHTPGQYRSSLKGRSL